MKLTELKHNVFDTLETIFLLIFATGLGLLLLQNNYANYTLLAGTVLLSILYWHKAITVYRNEKIKKRLAYRLVWYGLMMSPLAIYSKLNFYETSDNFLLLTIIILLAAFGVRLYQKLTKKDTVPYGDFFRLIIALIMCIYIFSLPLPV